MVSATALPQLSDNETLVRNMHSHTALSTADRYNNGGPPPLPLTNSKSAGNLANNAQNQVGNIFIRDDVNGFILHLGTRDIHISIQSTGMISISIPGLKLV